MSDSDIPIVSQTEGGVNTADVATETVINQNGVLVHRQIIREVNSDMIKSLLQELYLNVLTDNSQNDLFLRKGFK